MGAFISLIICEVALVISAVLSGLTIASAGTKKKVQLYNGINIAMMAVVFIVTLLIAIFMF